MDRNTALSALIDLRQICIEEGRPKIAEAVGVGIEALSEPKIVRCKGCNYFLGADEDTFCGLCSREDTQGDAETATTTDCISRADTIKAMCQECKVFLGDGVNCADCTEVAIVKGMPPVKLKNPCGSLLKSDPDECKEQKSKLDCISRQQAVEAVHKYFVDAIDKTPHEIDEDGDDVYADMKAVNELLKHNKHISKAIKALPPVTPTERTGEWIYITNPIGEKICVCSECEHIKQQGYREYCGHCGAKMGGDTE